MIAISGEDKQTIYITRGDTPQEGYNIIAFKFPIYNFATKQVEDYEFQLTDKIKFVVYEKKGYTKKEIINKEYTIASLGYERPTTTPTIPLTESETLRFPISNKKQTYWYELVLNGTTTMIGYDNDGAKKFIVLPGSEEE